MEKKNNKLYNQIRTIVVIEKNECLCPTNLAKSNGIRRRHTHTRAHTLFRSWTFTTFIARLQAGKENRKKIATLTNGISSILIPCCRHQQHHRTLTTTEREKKPCHHHHHHHHHQRRRRRRRTFRHSHALHTHMNIKERVLPSKNKIRIIFRYWWWWWWWCWRWLGASVSPSCRLMVLFIELIGKGNTMAKKKKKKE